ncbi:hypothetical protein FACS189455_2830 [Bacteroidia bacterium]|nr:hypothetical protein FACS189455_2830 [Bacteroidia bacterium]
MGLDFIFEKIIYNGFMILRIDIVIIFAAKLNNHVQKLFTQDHLFSFVGDWNVIITEFHSGRFSREVLPEATGYVIGYQERSTFYNRIRHNQ